MINVILTNTFFLRYVMAKTTAATKKCPMSIIAPTSSVTQNCFPTPTRHYGPTSPSTALASIGCSNVRTETASLIGGDATASMTVGTILMRLDVG